MHHRARKLNHGKSSSRKRSRSQAEFSLTVSLSDHSHHRQVVWRCFLQAAIPSKTTDKQQKRPSWYIDEQKQLMSLTRILVSVIFHSVSWA